MSRMSFARRRRWAFMLSSSCLALAAHAQNNPTPPSSAFNPAISAILSGTYSYLQRDPGTWRLNGFQPGGEIGPGARSFSLGESEILLSGNVDPTFYGQLVLAVSGEDEIAAEEAFVQTTALAGGTTLKFGRFFSGIGYLNEQHAHATDFIDAPLAYQAFVGGQFAQEGVQLKWVAPATTFIELALELGRGARFPASDGNRNRPEAAALVAHAGGDVGASHSWRAGAAQLWTRATARGWDDTDLTGAPVTSQFDGRSRTLVLDAVWKWAPQGNATRTNLKLQGEWFRRRENGTVTTAVDDPAALTDAYVASQSGYYLQGVWQFMPRWRVGLRQDELDPGDVDYGANNAVLARPQERPRRTSVMTDWSVTEFSRLRLQLAQDRARGTESDRQLFVQYQMSLGAHGAHGF